MKLLDIIKGLRTVYNGEPWYGNNLQKILDSIRDSDPNTSIKGSHSLGQILEHMTQWKRYVLEMVEGHFDFHIEVDSQEDWNKGKTYTPEEYESLITEFTRISEQLINRLKSEDDFFLMRSIPDKNCSMHTLIEGIIHHDIYHAGQLSLLKKV